MYFFALTSPSAPARLVRLVACAVLPIASAVARPTDRLIALYTPSASRPAPRTESSPYLLVCLPPALRFASPVEAANPTAPLPTVIGPPHPAGIVEEIASMNQEAAMSSSPPVHHPVHPPAANHEARGQNKTTAQVTPPEVGVAILPDETARQITPADVLLYFEFPAATPSSGQPLPRSSATYQQQ